MKARNIQLVGIILDLLIGAISVCIVKFMRLVVLALLELFVIKSIATIQPMECSQQGIPC